jgi:SWI/SNF-related matrix-associated actin-dependent regulator of chromatin subfamily A-like protein 1
LQKFGAVYNKKLKAWILNINEYQEALLELNAFCKPRGICVDPIPESLFDLFEFKIPFTDPTKQNVPEYDYTADLLQKPRLTSLPKPLMKALYDFQKVGVQFGIDRFGRVLIGDEMGVGKTIQAISIAYLYRNDWPLLVICPSSLRLTWRDEIMNWIKLPEEEIQIFGSSFDEFNPKCNAYIISYNIANRLAGALMRRNFRVAIADEAHYLKSRDSQRARNLVPLLMRAKRVILLSGTPILARPVEIYNLARIIRPDIFHSF